MERKNRTDNNVKILTTIQGKPGRFWGENTTYVIPGQNSYSHEPINNRLVRLKQSIKVLLTLIMKKKYFDVLVLEGYRTDTLFIILQLLSLTKKPILLVGCRWYISDNRFKRIMDNFIRRIIDRSVSKYVVWARHEIEDYSKAFNIKTEKIEYLPFHTTLVDYKYNIEDKGYIFAGGNGDRDYKTLIEAVRGLPINVFIAATDQSLFKGIQIPTNITIRGVSHSEFRQKMASSRINVVPMQSGRLHSGGQQTFLNAMFMKKPTVIVGPKAADGYIENGVNGFVVDYGDVESLKKIICLLYDDSSLRKKIGEAAHSFAAQLTTDRFVRRLFMLAESIVSN